MSLEQDYKTKYFLDKIDLLISRGVIRNHSEVVQALNWNKSVMSSVKSGKLPVPQHIYNKFKEVYSEYLNEKPSPNDEGYKEKYITLLEQRNEDLERRLQDQVNLERLRRDQNQMFALLVSYQQHWLKQQVQNPKKFAEALRSIQQSALEDQERLLQQGTAFFEGNGGNSKS